MLPFMNLLYKTFLKKLFYIVILSFAFLPVQANAYTDDGGDVPKATGAEKAVFAYFRLANKAPDYEKWISDQNTYKGLDDTGKEEFLISESLRLGQAFGQYDLDYDPLILHVPVTSTVVSAKDGNPPYFLTEFVNLDENQDVPSFNFDYGDDKIALIINGLKIFHKMPLTDEQYALMKEKAGASDESFPAMLEIHVRPTEADHNRALIDRNGTQIWLMAGKIAYLKCSFQDIYNSSEVKLWDYVAPWYQDIFKEKNTPEEEKYPSPFDLYKK